MTRYALDTECYKDYFLLMIRDIDTGSLSMCDRWPGKPLGVSSLPEGTYVTFNGINYDFPILSLALNGADCQTLKAASDDIIVNGFKPWHIRDKYGGVDLSNVDHIDLIEVAPGMCGLKTYAGRLHSVRMQDLPIQPSASISVEDRTNLQDYCGNSDIPATIDLFHKLKPQLDMREAMSSEFGIDLRSKSDAQLAEAIVKKEVEKRLGHRIFRPEIHPEYRFKYIVPPYINFMAKGMQLMLNVVRNTEFSLTEKGSVEMPHALESMHVRIGQSVYKMGIGGLHSTESSVAHVADNKTKIFDIDVTGYYPNLMINLEVCPPSMGKEFLTVFKELVRRRQEAKASGNTFIDAGLKTGTVSCFGKFGSKWSTLYAPESLIQVTLTGQLSLLMLIELMESAGIPVVSANTDGLVVKCAVEKETIMSSIVAAWEIATGLTMEYAEYSAIYAKDVNNYFALKADGSVKQKGIYSFVGSKKSELEKNPTNFICVDAVANYLSSGVSLDHTIRTCTDIRRFMTIRKVEGGAVCKNKYLGRVVRWYYGEDKDCHIEYSANGNKVARSEGAVPLMNLPDKMPNDLDYQWYEDEAASILKDIGARK